MKPLLNLIFAASVAFVTLQAVYWPLIMKPGTELQFWQMQWAAEIGYRVGAAVVTAVMMSPLTGLMQDVLAIALSILWAIAVVWVINVLIRNVPAKQNNT
jgi:Sec-independent protein secretion pathway component TatC